MIVEKDISLLIEKVIDKRKNKAKELKTLQEKILILQEKEGIIRNISIELKKSGEKDLISDFESFLQTDVRSNIQELQNHLFNVREFLEKDTINIGLGGTARVGKSTFLQTISGLSDDVIPTSDRDFCTGAKSIINHFEGANYAEVTFFNESEFIKIIQDTYREVGIDGAPMSVYEFENCNLPELDYNEALKNTYYHKLKDLKKNINEYKIYIGSNKKRINIYEVIDYVAQSKNIEGQIKRINQYRAVKKVDIYTNFPIAKIKKLALVDLPGLDEVAPAIKERLVESLKKELDIIIIIRKASDTGDGWRKTDSDIIQLINSNIYPENIFIILNQDGRNEIQTEIMYKSALENRKNNIFKFNDIFKANVKKDEELEINVLNPILDYLLNNINKMDEKILTELEEEYNGIYIQFESLINSVRNKARNYDIRSLDSSRFSKLFDMLISQIKSQMQNFINEYLDENNILAKNFYEDFENNIEMICNEAFDSTVIPNTNEIKLRANQEGGYENAFNLYLIDIRVQLIKKFKKLDSTFEKFIIMNYQRLIDELCSIEPMNNFMTKMQIKDGGPRNTIGNFYEFLSSVDKDKYSNLITLFKKMIDFNFNYESHFHYIIRKNMDQLNTFNKSGITLSEMQNPESIMMNLIPRKDETIYKMKKDLLNKKEYIFMAIYSLFEDFVDIIARDQIVKEELRNLTADYREIFWDAEYQSLNKKSLISRNINQLIEKIS